MHTLFSYLSSCVDDRNRRWLRLFAATILILSASLAVAGGSQVLLSSGPTSGTAWFSTLNQHLTGDWQHYGQLFTNLQKGLFPRLFLLVLTIIPAVFLLHYIVIGPKSFAHTGLVKFFGILTRILHWLAALSFTLLVVTGLMVIFGRFLAPGGGQFIMAGRTVHLIAAIVFTCSAACLFLIWLKDMFPMPYDILWLLIMGGYLSKKKKPVPAGKFNLGQKMWFWLATVGGGVMAWSGYLLYSFAAPVDQLRQMVIIHNFLGAALVGFFLVHLYMSLFAIKGSLTSMITGYKPREEVEILHSRYTI
jgi:formate dehydrogenase subunit gamma